MGELLEERIAKLGKLEETAALGGGREKIDKQHAAGKLTARERLDRLLDPGSLVELGKLFGHLDAAPGDGIVAGHGTIDGRPVYVYSQDATVYGGSIGGFHGNKMYRTVERALNAGGPLIGLHDSPGARETSASDLRMRPGMAALSTGGLGGGEARGLCVLPEY